MAVAVVTGLAAEARIARRSGITAMATGGDRARMEAIAESLLAADGTALVSFGIAGALAPGLAPGTILLPRRVLSEKGEVIAVDAALHAPLRDELRALGLVAIEDDIVGATRIVAAPHEKADLHRRTEAVAVDLESHAAATAAQRLDRPFLVLRAVADPASLALPPAAAVGIDAEGRAAVVPVLRSLLRWPGQLPDLVRLARHTRCALASLARAAPALRAAF